MFQNYIFQVFGFVALGYAILKTIIKRYEIEIDFFDRYIISIILGYSSFVIPAIVVTFFTNGKLAYVVYAHYFLGEISLLFVALLSLRKIDRHDITKEITTILKIKRFKFILIYLFGFIFIVLLYPERGWDALHYYFPNALYFYLQNDIPSGLNPLSFFPTFKPPLNTLLITYSFYVAGDMTANLHAIVFLTGTMSILYKLSMKLTNDKEVSMNAIVFFLTIPLTYFLIYEYAYYQELSLMFFLSAVFYIMYSKKSENIKFYATIASISFATAILSKLTGIAIFPLLIIIFPIEKIPKLMRFIFIAGLTLFLSYKASTTVYIGIGILVLIIGTVLIYDLIIKNDGDETIKLSTFVYFLIIPTIVLVIWVKFMLSVPNIEGVLISRYLRGGASLLFHFPSTTNPNLIYLENGMEVSFLSSILYLFTSMLFVPTWLLLKLLGFRESKKYSIIYRWILGYLLIYYGYHSNVSARYLVPILIPFSIVLSIGFSKFVRKLNIRENTLKDFAFYLTVLTSYGFYYPFIPVRLILTLVNERFYYFHSELLILFTYIILFLLITIKMTNRINHEKMKIKHVQLLTKIIIGIILISPFGVQSYFYVKDGFNIDQTQAEIAYYDRPNYQNMIEFVRGLNLEFNALIISVNTPGVEYFVKRSVLDLFLISGSNEFNQSLTKLNTQQAESFISKYNVQVIITLEGANVFYNIYINQFSKLSLIKLTSNTKLFDKVFTNSEYSVFQKITQVPNATLYDFR